MAETPPEALELWGSLCEEIRKAAYRMGFCVDRGSPGRYHKPNISVRPSVSSVRRVRIALSNLEPPTIEYRYEGIGRITVRRQGPSDAPRHPTLPLTRGLEVAARAEEILQPLIQAVRPPGTCAKLDSCTGKHRET